MTDQISFLPLLDERKGENLHGRIERERMEFCDVAWKKANGDLVAYVRECVANTSIMYAPCVRITCGLVYPKCYYEVDVHDMTGGCASPLMQDYSPNFDVHEHTANVMLMVESDVRRRCMGYKIPDKLIETALGMMSEQI